MKPRGPLAAIRAALETGDKQRAYEIAVARHVRPILVQKLVRDERLLKCLDEVSA